MDNNNINMISVRKMSEQNKKIIDKNTKKDKKYIINAFIKWFNDIPNKIIENNIWKHEINNGINDIKSDPNISSFVLCKFTWFFDENRSTSWTASNNDYVLSKDIQYYGLFRVLYDIQIST